MLKYKILNNNNTTEIVSIDYENYEVNDDRNMLTFYLSKSNIVNNNDTIIMDSTIIIDDIANNVTNNYNFQLTTEAIVNEDKQLSLNIPTFFQLTPNKATLYEDNSSGQYIDRKSVV